MKKTIENKQLKYAYNSKSNIEFLEFSKNMHFINKKLDAKEYLNAYIVPDTIIGTCFMGGVFDANRYPIKDSFQRDGFNHVNCLIKNLQFDDIRYIDKDVIYLGQIRNHWGSFLVDSIGRIWISKLCNPDAVYVFSATHQSIGKELHKNIWRFLELSGIKKEQIMYLEEPTRFKRVLIPDNSFVPFLGYYKEYLSTISDVVNNATTNSKKYERIYFSRWKFSKNSKSDFGEEQIINLFNNNTFKIVYPEEESLDNQISYIINCKCFCSIGGSLAHNIIFAAPLKNKPAMYLFNRMNGYQWHQWMINEAAGVKLNYVDFYSEPFRLFFHTPVNGPFLYKINKNVKGFICDTGLKYKYSFKKGYLKQFLLYAINVIKTILFLTKNKRNY